MTKKKTYKTEDAIDDLLDEDADITKEEADTILDLVKPESVKYSPTVFTRKARKQPQVLGFVGYKGSGKDESAKVLDDDTQLVKMADCLKDMLRTLLQNAGLENDEIDDMIEGHLKEVPSVHLQGKTPRWAMQSLGTEWGRNLIGDQIWIDIVREQILDSKTKVVLTDVRFHNEAKMLRECGAKLVRIVREGNGFTGHASEAEIEHIKCDAIIGNNSTIDELQRQVVAVVETLA